MPFTLNTSASFAMTSTTSSGDNWGRAYQTKTTINKDGTTRTKRTQRLGEPIIEETRRWDGKGRRVLEDGSVYEKNGKGKGWVQVQAPTVKPIQNGNSGRGKRKGTILGMTCEPSKNVVGNGNGLGSNFGKGGVGKGTENWLNGIMGKMANDALESRGRGRILQVVDSEESEGDYTDSEEYTSGEYTSSEEEEEEVEEKPSAKKSTTTSQTKSKTGAQKQQKPKKEVEKKQKPTKTKIVQESSSEEEEEEDDDDDDGYEIEEVISSDEEESEEDDEDEEEEEEKEKEEEKPQAKKPVEKTKLPKGKNAGEEEKEEEDENEDKPQPKKPVEKKPAEKPQLPKGKNAQKSVAMP